MAQLNMDVEKSSSSSFEDLTNAEDTQDLRAAQAAASESETTIPKRAAASFSDNDDDAKSAADVVKPYEKKVEDAMQAAVEQSEVEDEDVCDILGNNQLLKRIIKKAPDGAKRPARGDLVTITYTGKLEDGTVVEREEHFQCHVGDFEVVQGLDMVLPMMHVGEVAQVNVDPRFAYGALGLKIGNTGETVIAPNAQVNNNINLMHREKYNKLFFVYFSLSMKLNWWILSTKTLRILSHSSCFGNTGKLSYNRIIYVSIVHKNIYQFSTRMIK